MSAQPSNPHDAYFRHVLARPADAASELRTALPDALARRINWSRLQLQPGSSSPPNYAPDTAICSIAPTSTATRRTSIFPVTQTSAPICWSWSTTCEPCRQDRTR
ncbi:Rpn family recombination-promoting nuclease/putative transposase [Nocardia grenadensis]|uniref:Rpn family recombination-promoting nuclease/putative transposase n=1 Tax=Nocardia grenadensis TaxID=931537 RepID=UPI003D8F7CD1